MRQPGLERAAEPQKNEPIPAVWTPASAGASPVAEKKEFRPVPFESPVLSRKKQPREEVCLINRARGAICTARRTRLAISRGAGDLREGFENKFL